MVARRHPIFKSLRWWAWFRCGMCDEHITNNIVTLSTADIAAQYTDARLAQMIREGVDTIVLKLNTSIMAEDDPNVGIDFSISGANSLRITALADVGIRFLALGGKAVVWVYAQGGSADFYTALVTCGANDESPMSGFIGYIRAVRALMGSLATDPRLIQAWAVEPRGTGLTNEDYGYFHHRLFVSPGGLETSEFPEGTWLMPTQNYSGPTDLATAIMFKGDTEYTRPNCMFRSAYYGNSEDFILTHGRLSDDYFAMHDCPVAIELPFTQANHDAIIAWMDNEFGSGGSDYPAPTNETRLRADLAGLVGFDRLRVERQIALLAQAQKQHGVPVLLEEVGFYALNIDIPARRKFFNWVKRACRKYGIKFCVFSAGTTTAGSIGFGTSAGINTYDSAIRTAQADCKIEISGGRFVPPPAWTPESLGSKLLAWYDFSLVIGANGAAVSSVFPRAGTWTEAISSSGASRPTIASAIVTMNSVRGLAFTATQYLDSPTISRVIPFDVTMACDPTINVAIGGDRYTSYFDTPTGTSPRLGLGALRNSGGTTQNWFLVNSGSVWIDYNVNANFANCSNPQIAMARFSTTTNAGSIRISGNVIKTGQHTAATWTKIRVGANLNGTDGLNGYVTDVVITTDLTTEEVYRLEIWLANKTGVSLTSNPYTGGPLPIDASLG